MDLTDIKKLLEDTLIHYGMTGGQFAKATGVSQSVISKILTGKKRHVSSMHLAPMMPWLQREVPIRGE